MIAKDAWVSVVSLLKNQASLAQENYKSDESGNYRLMQSDPARLAELETALKSVGFTSLRFTHKDSSFQFYGLENLWPAISEILEELYL